MLVLEGPQGILKSSALATLCHDESWFLEDLRDIHGKDALMQFGGKWLVEIAELQSFRAADLAASKPLSRPAPTTIAHPMRRVGQDFPRSIVLAGTVNEDRYLKDYTGARRFWCFVCGTIDLEALPRPATSSGPKPSPPMPPTKPGGSTTQKSSKPPRPSRKNAASRHPWEDAIADFLDGKTETTTAEVFTHLETPNGMQGARAKIARTKREEMTIGKILRLLGWERQRTGWGPNRRRVWVKAENDRKAAENRGTTSPSGTTTSNGGGPAKTQPQQPPAPPGPPGPPIAHRDTHARSQEFIGKGRVGGAGGPQPTQPIGPQSFSYGPPDRGEVVPQNDGGPPI